MPTKDILQRYLDGDKNIVFEKGIFRDVTVNPTRIIAVINVYNEAKTIERAIESIYDHVDIIVICDGAYKQFPHDKPYSTDGTQDIVKKYSKVKLIETDRAWANQCVKRSAMFIGREGDYYCKLDGDEYVTNPELIRKAVDEKIDVGWAWVLSDLYHSPIMTARIFKHQNGIHYAGRHHWLYNGRNIFITSDQNMNPRFNHRDTPIRIMNCRHARADERKQEKHQFLHTRNIEELSFNKEGEVYGDYTRMIAHPRRASSKLRNPCFRIRHMDNPKYTLTLMFSRSWAVKRFFDNFRKLNFPQNIEAVVVVDSKDDNLRTSIYDWFVKDERFGEVKIYYTDNHKLDEFSNVNERRQRIIDNWHIIITEARGQYILGAEDDSLPMDKNSYISLLKRLHDKKADFVQGNIVGRWKSKMYPAWQVEEKEGKPYRVYTLPYQNTGVSEIQGCGWYCFVCHAEILVKYSMQLNNDLPLGPDLNFGYQLARNGYKLLHDWEVPVLHFGTDFELIPGQSTEVLKLIKDGNTWKNENE